MMHDGRPAAREDRPPPTPQREIIEDPDVPLEAPIDDVNDPTVVEGPMVAD